MKVKRQWNKITLKGIRATLCAAGLPHLMRDRKEAGGIGNP
jgi:hypothetical protein